jgi:hypothetical protein
MGQKKRITAENNGFGLGWNLDWVVGGGLLFPMGIKKWGVK